jgi:outer membrane immunogenic protein
MRLHFLSATSLATTLMFLVPGIALAQTTLHDWSGPYIGLTAGIASGVTHFDITGGTDTTIDVPVLGATGTLTLGVNGQNGAFVYGIAADGTLLTLKGSNSQPGQAIDTALDRLLALRGRLGLATGPLMVYATAGIAAGHETFTTDISVITPTLNQTPAIADGYVYGPTYGLGVEVALNEKVSLVAEGVVTNLGGLTATGDNGKGSNSAYTATATHTDMNLRAGINIRF